MSDKVNILGILVDKVTVEQASDRIMQFTDMQDQCRSVFTPNSEIIMMGYRDESFRDMLNHSDLLTADGIGVVYAAKIVKNPLQSRAAGYDIACSLLEKMGKKSKKLYLFGSKPGVAEAAGKTIQARYPGVQIVGYSDGYFNAEKEKTIISNINRCSPDVVFVCLGAPAQEKWIAKHKAELNAKVCLGIGGSIDVFAGNVKRAPEFYTKHGLEWLYRLLKQPSRFGRMMDLPRFALKVLINGKKYPQVQVDKEN